MIINSYKYKTVSETLDLTGLTAYYKFESNGSDSYGSYTATLFGSPSFGGGKIGTALTCVSGASSEYARIVDYPAFSFTDGSDTPCSISCWVYSSTGDEAWLVNKRDGAGHEWNFITNNGSFFFTLFDNGSTSAYIGQDATYAMPSSTWVHFLATYDASATAYGIKLYIDGILQSSSPVITGSYTGMSDTTSKVYIGVAGFDILDTLFGLDGELDLLQIWNRELSADEVKVIYDLEYAGTHITD